MKIFITGIAGFIGFHVAKRLSKLDYSVVGIDNINDYYDINLKYKRLEQLGFEKKNIKGALVLGGGIAGIQAALDLANAQFQVYLVERESSIGGTMAKLDKTFPSMDCAI